MSFLQFFSERQLPRLRANIAEPWGTGPGLARAKIGARGNAVFECVWFLEPDPLTVSNSHIRGLGLSLALWSEILAVNRSGRSPPDKSAHSHETSRECQFYMLRSWKFIMQIIWKSLCAGPGKTENIHYPVTGCFGDMAVWKRIKKMGSSRLVWFSRFLKDIHPLI